MNYIFELENSRSSQGHGQAHEQKYVASGSRYGLQTSTKTCKSPSVDCGDLINEHNYSHNVQYQYTHPHFMGNRYFQFRFVLITCAVYCPACQTYLIATRFWVVVICPIIKCLTVLEFYFILFDLCLFITIFNFILNYVPIVTFWIFTYHKIWILFIIFCFIWNYWIIYF